MRQLIRSIVVAVGLSVGLSAWGAPLVKPGIEVLRESGFQALKGKRVGLITNPTGVHNALK